MSLSSPIIIEDDQTAEGKMLQAGAFTNLIENKDNLLYCTKTQYIVHGVCIGYIPGQRDV